jgi:anti-sigma regulatory factor (Ser/Thr protein kinase)
MGDPIHEAIPLEGTAEDAPTARGAARAAFRRARVDEDLAGDALLCLSELVTNALLHAGGAVCVEITATPTAVRLEVTDRMSIHDSPDLVADAAARAALGADAIDRETGRGLGIVEQLCHAWGVTAVDVEGQPGKILWADLVGSPQTPPIAGQPAARPITSRPTDGGGAPDSDTREATLLDVPIRLYLASEAHIEALLRDMQLLAADWTSRNDPLVKGLAEALRRNSAARTASMEEVRRRIDAGADVIELRFPVSSDTPATAATFLDVVAECDERTGRGGERADPASAELRHFRRWYVAELTHQANGGSPRRCPFRP